MSATLRLARGTFGIELRRGRFEIVIDGRSVGSIENRETVETSLEPGRHTLRLRAGRYASRAVSFDVADRDLASFQCHGAMIWPTYVASLILPNMAISLRRQ
jgi:hypothetical protein